MFHLNFTPGRTAFVDNKELLFFSGYAYLGMNHEPEFLQHLQKGIELYGAVFPSSRISNTQLNLYSETEKLLSDLTQTADTVLLQTGFTAGKAAVASIAADSVLFHSPFCHPAIRIKNNSILSFTDWANETVDTINKNIYSTPPVILSDALNQLTAELYDFSFLNSIEQNIICIIDDSHGMGLLGTNGEGISSRLPRKENIEYIITYSLSKAMNIQAGAVSCSNKSTADKIRKSSWYAATTPPSPVMLYAFNHSQKIYQQQRATLNKNKKFLQDLLSKRNYIHFHPEIPVFIFPEEYDEDFFAKQNIIISSFAYPDPSGKKINRAVINALHTDDDLQKLADAMNA
ncbi:8-amino-7-oxononanoate synthase [mine drainage metagenome]|uniref:8-amino-7-oxononanoate synthase n=1 Tax=mine drainage metagenome TaxID=410659 RepID=A0A1J5TGI2_9ZZZZ